MEENRSPPACPSTVSVRRNPHRKARDTPVVTAAKPFAFPSVSSKPHDVPSFPIDEILAMPIPESESKSPVSENLKVYLRIKPLKISTTAVAKNRPRNVWPQNPSKKNKNPEITKKMKKIEQVCVTVNDSSSVTLTPPSVLQELKRSKTEVYEGFSHVFQPDCSQKDVYQKMVHPLLEDFLRGKSGMLAALGPSGSGKTHTVFGSSRDPGIVPLALRQIFRQGDENSPESSRFFYLSIFEICSERGKVERASDLLGGSGSELFVQQSTIKGLQEVVIKNVEEAESSIAQAMLKRATAMTNSNSQSSRSQCIINIRGARAKDSGVRSSDAVLTIVDLAGAEREKRTGNQGERLVESNFINNTSMVFGQCLRSLMEYQKNRKKGLQKHYHNSLLTRYLRDYLEGKKRMALILTVKAGEDDYLDTSLLLKQASPYMKIKFDNADEPCNKRQLQTFLRAGKNKKIKLSPKISKIEEVIGGEKIQISEEGNLQAKKIDEINSSSPRRENVDRDKDEREHIIMRNFAKVLWNVLKQNNEKLKVAESEIRDLRENLENERLKNLGLETELTRLKSEFLCSRLVMIETRLPEVEAGVDAEERLAVDARLSNEVSNSDNNVDIIASPPDDYRRDECSNKSAMAETEDKYSNKPTELEIMHSFNGIETEVKGSAIITSQLSECDGSCRASSSELAAKGDTDEERLECTNRVSNTPPKSAVLVHRSSNSDKQEESVNILGIEQVQEETLQTQCNNDGSLSNQTKSMRSRRCPNSEKLKRNRRRVPESPRLVSEEMNAVNIQEHGHSSNTEAVGSKAKAAALTNKPRRRLLPASSVLLAREINTLDIEDDVVETKGNRGVRKTVAEAPPRSHGSSTLLRLLSSNLHL